MANEWEIKTRGNRCTTTGRDFVDGEYFHTLLFRDKEGFLREDLCEEAWQERKTTFAAKGTTGAPFSSWKTKYEIPPPPPPEPLGKKTAEDLLRRYMEEPGTQHGNVRYILALMLERKRILKPIETKVEAGERFLIYERRGTGEVFVILDPDLKLDQIDAVQTEVAELLG